MVKIGIVGGKLYEMVSLHPYRKWMDDLDDDDIEKFDDDYLISSSNLGKIYRSKKLNSAIP